MTYNTPNETTPILNQYRSSDQELNKVNLPTIEDKVEDIISEIGFGKFQYCILALTGLGWLSDNLWLQTVTAILIPVQIQFKVSHFVVGFLPSSIFAGMMFGSLFWGIFSDIHGRKLAFNLTLLIGFIFGTCASFATSFSLLCISLLCVGFGVGGNMPVDSAIFLEFTPVQSRHLLTSLSTFFSFATLLVGGVCYFIIPPYSCSIDDSNCDVNVYNNGWRYVLLFFSILTAFMVIFRAILFKLPESPMYLLAQGRIKEAIEVLHHINKFNGSKISFNEEELYQLYYDSLNPNSPSLRNSAEENNRNHRPKPINDQLGFNSNLIKDLLSPQYFWTSILIWLIWILMALAFITFVSFLTKFFIFKGIGQEGQKTTYEDVYLDLIKFATYCVPGSIFGAYLADSPLGRKGSMALSTFGSAISLAIFTFSDVRWIIQSSSYIFSFLTTMMYAVTYCYTPEVFEPRLRGTGSGIAAFAGRVMGTLAPLISGYLFSFSPYYPLILSTISFVLLSIIMMCLPIETRNMYH